VSHVQDRRKKKGGYKGDKPWQARWLEPDGRERTKAFAMKGAAEDHLTTVANQQLTGTYIDVEAGRTTCGEWIDRWLDDTPKRETTRARDRCVIDKWFRPKLKARPLGKVTPVDVRAIVKSMTDELAARTVRTNYGILRAAFNAAVEAELIARTPCRGVRLPIEQQRDPRFCSAEELQTLAAAIPLEYRPMIYLAGVVGLRWSEVAGLRVGRLDFLRRTITVAETIAEVDGRHVVAPPKTPASHATLSVPVPVMEMLSEHLARRGRPGPDELVFVTTNGGPLRATNFRNRVWQPACVTSGLGRIVVDRTTKKKHYDGLTFHGLRHSAAGLMISLGAHPKVIQQRMRHASVRTTLDVYGRVLPELDDRVTEGLGELVAQAPRKLSRNGDGTRASGSAR
jgi:integrase